MTVGVRFCSKDITRLCRMPCPQSLRIMPARHIPSAHGYVSVTSFLAMPFGARWAAHSGKSSPYRRNPSTKHTTDHVVSSDFMGGQQYPSTEGTVLSGEGKVEFADLKRTRATKKCIRGKLIMHRRAGRRRQIEIQNQHVKNDFRDGEKVSTLTLTISNDQYRKDCSSAKLRESATKWTGEIYWRHIASI